VSKKPREKQPPWALFDKEGVVVASARSRRFPKWATKDYFAKRYVHLHDIGAQKTGNYYWTNVIKP
jgi:hypothetical protein